MASLGAPEGNNGDSKEQVLVASGAIAWVPTNRFLVIKRSETVKRNGGKREFPCGKLAKGDDTVEAVLLRELLEELGIKPKDLHRIFRMVDNMPIIDLDDGRRLIISRIKMALRRMPKIRLREGRSDHVQAQFLNREEFLALASSDPTTESGVFVPKLEFFLRELFEAVQVRGCIIDALAPGVDLDLQVVTFSTDGSHVLYNPASCGVRSVGDKEHVDDVLRDMIPVDGDPVRKKIIQWSMREEKERKGIKASLGIVLTSPRLDISSPLPEGCRWLETSSNEVHHFVNATQGGFRRSFLKKAVDNALSAHPVFSDWVTKDSELLKKQKRISGTHKPI